MKHSAVRSRRRWPALVLSLVVMVVAPAALPAADWPCFLGPRANSISPERGINKEWSRRPPRGLWRVPLGDDGYAGPSVAGGRVYIVDHQGSRDVVRALDLATGREVWRFTYDDTEKRLYGFARATPTVAGGKVYTLSRLGLALCLDAGTGRKVWSRHLVRDFGGRMPQWGYAASPLVDGDRLILCPGGPTASVTALDRRTGKTLWRGGGSDPPGYATPVVATLGGRRQYVVFSWSGLMGVDAATGRRRWHHPWMTHIEPKLATPSALAHLNSNAATPVVIGNTVFITTDYGRGCALIGGAGARAKAQWESKAIQSHFSSPVVLDGHVYCTSEPNKLVCLELATGRVCWEQRGFGKGGLVGVDGALIAVDGRSGDVALVNATPQAYQELGRIRPLGGESRTAPIIADGRLLLRNRRALACLDLRPPAPGTRPRPAEPGH